MACYYCNDTKGGCAECREPVEPVERVGPTVVSMGGGGGGSRLQGRVKLGDVEVSTDELMAHHRACIARRR